MRRGLGPKAEQIQIYNEPYRTGVHSIDGNNSYLNGNNPYPTGVHSIDEAEELYQILKKAREEKKLSKIDELTGCENRRALEEFCSEFHPRYAFLVVFLDLAYFKHVNDKYGHQAGDQVLIKLVDHLKKEFRIHSREDFLFRKGGDEFVLICQHVSDQPPDEDEMTRFVKDIENKLKAISIPVITDRDKTTESVLADFGYVFGQAVKDVQQKIDLRSLIDQADKNMCIYKDARKRYLLDSRDRR